mmetsp:Transcript_43719/g.59737  ORF Transcript_43719/g.59737 Transcript_43719/m.59737 type:complete len:89 (-) Transcript_43719:169-435(-)
MQPGIPEGEGGGAPAGSLIVVQGAHVFFDDPLKRSGYEGYRSEESSMFVVYKRLAGKETHVFLRWLLLLLRMELKDSVGYDQVRDVQF